MTSLTARCQSYYGTITQVPALTYIFSLQLRVRTDMGATSTSITRSRLLVITRNHDSKNAPRQMSFDRHESLMSRFGGMNV